MKQIFFVLACLFSVGLNGHAQPQQQQRIAAVDQWAHIITRVSTIPMAYQVADLLADTRTQVEAITDPVRDRDFRWALQQEEKWAYAKAHFLETAQKLPPRLRASQSRLFQMNLAQALRLAQDIVRGKVGRD